MSYQQERQRRAIPRRASLPPEEQRTTQEYLSPTVSRQITRQYDAPADAWNEEDDEEPEARRSHFPKSALRYATSAQRELAPIPQPINPVPRYKQKHPLLYVGVGMLGALGLATLLLGPVGSWWQDVNDSRLYGYPRTYQTDAVVGQNDSASHPSHFIALNLHDQILVIEFPGGDPSKARDFLISTTLGLGANRFPVTLTFADVNGDGKPDMIIEVEGQRTIYINDHGTFRPAKPGEALNLNG